MTDIGRRRQSEIFIAGLGGRGRRTPASPEGLEAAARGSISRNGWAYLRGGAGLERTMASNRAAFDRRRIVQRMLRDVSERDLSVELYGRRLPLPLLLAPIGVLDLAHENGDCAAARAAAAQGVPFIASSQSSRPLEEIAQASGRGPRWFQLYWSSKNELTESLVHRAEAAGYEAIVLTLDTTRLGWRPRDLDRAYLPFLRGRGIANYVTDPVFRSLPEVESKPEARPRVGLRLAAALLETVRFWPEGRRRALGREAREAVRRFVAIYSRPDLTWDDLPFLRDRTRLPILLKGIVHPDDAHLAVEAGMDGVIVSNHGGRQVDGAIAALDALPAVAQAVGGRVPVLFDSGVRTGADVMKAICLGARAVLIGRPYAYGLAVAGEAGAREVIADLAADLDLTLGLSGRRSLAELDASLLAPAAGSLDADAPTTETADDVCHSPRDPPRRYAPFRRGGL